MKKCLIVAIFTVCIFSCDYSPYSLEISIIDASSENGAIVEVNVYTDLSKTDEIGRGYGVIENGKCLITTVEVKNGIATEETRYLEENTVIHINIIIDPSADFNSNYHQYFDESNLIEGGDHLFEYRLSDLPAS